MSRFPGNIIKLPNVTPTQSSASGVWSLKDQMVYQRNNLWPFQRDPYFNYTTLLLQGNVPNTTGPQAMTLPLAYNADASTNNFLVTPNGDVGPRPFSPYFGGNYSVYFDGTGDYLTAGVASDWTFLSNGASNYTIEAWVYLSSVSAQQFICSTNSAGAAVGVSFAINSSAQPYLDFTRGVGGSFATFTATGVLTANAWNHVAVTFATSGKTASFYINGVAVGSSSNTDYAYSSSTPSNALNIAREPSGSGLVTGYISNLRITNTIVYTGAFTPSLTSLENISGTSLLTCQSNRFIDNSSTPKTITRYGDSRITDNSPFVSTDFTTGAGYFDGSDYLSIASTSTALPTGTQDYSVEAWFYWGTQTASFPQIITNPATDGFQIAYDVAAGTLSIGRYGVSPVVSYTVAQTALANQWTHVVATRSGNTHRLFINGVLRANGVNAVSFAALTTQTIGSAGAGNYFVGYMSDVRSVLGSIPTAYQTSSTTNGTTIFTPPATLLPVVSGTSLLTLQTRAPSQNINFIDSSPNEFIVTKNGNTTQGTFSPFSPTGWSNYFGGSAFAQIANNAAFGSLNGVDYTIEFWIYQTTISGDQAILGCTSIGVSGFAIWTLSGQLTAFFGGGSTITGATLTANQWNHIALVRTSTNTQLYLNGASQGTPSTSAFVNNTSQPLMIGGITTGTGWNSDRYTTGYISAVRIIKGQALSTGNFTPPTALASSTVVGWTGANVPTQSITGTVGILTCQYNRFFDQTGKTITTSGSPSVQAFSPFAPANAVSPLVTGGSGYFDGTSDYLSFPVNSFPFGANDFTIEAWVYNTGTTTGTFFNNQYTSGATTTSMIAAIGTASANFDMYVGSTVYSLTSVNPGLNQWVHIAFVRTGGTVSIFQNGSRTHTRSDLSTLSINAGGTTVAPQIGSGFFGYMSGQRIVIGRSVYDATATNIVVPTTPPTAIPNTSLLLNFTNGAAVDATGKNNLETVGKAQNSGVQAKFNYLMGGSSLQFDGSSGWLLAPTSANWDLGTGDFTVECWIRFVSIPTSPSFSAIVGKWGNGTYAWILQANSSVIRFYTGNSGSLSSFYDFSWTPSANTWYHLAVTRASSSLRAFVDGSQIGTTQPSVTQNLTSATAICAVGENRDGASGQAQYINGYLSNLRITKYARYTANFNTNLPTGPFPIG